MGRLGAEATSASKALKILHELGMHLRDNPEKTELAQDIVEILETRMGYEFLAVLVVTEPGRGMQPLALSKQSQDEAFLEADKAYVKSRLWSPAVGITHWVARSGQTVRLGNVGDDPRYFGIRDDIRSELCVPLLVGTEVIGVINTETTSSNAYTATDERFLETAACHVALAIKHNRRYGSGPWHVKRPADGSPLLAACSYCKRIRVDQGSWISPEAYLMNRSGIQFSHSICPPCYERVVGTEFHE